VAQLGNAHRGSGWWEFLTPELTSGTCGNRAHPVTLSRWWGYRGHPAAPSEVLDTLDKIPDTAPATTLVFEFQALHASSFQEFCTVSE